MKRVPLVVIAVLAVLAWLGSNARAYNGNSNRNSVVLCAHLLAEQDTPPADVLVVGSSRVGRGLDPGYMRNRIANTTGRDIRIERLSLLAAQTTQFRPLLKTYLDSRGAPEVVLLQLLFNFEADRHRYWDLPIHRPHTVAWTDTETLFDIQNTAVLNDHDTLLPRRFEANYTSAAALLLQKLEAQIYSALRYVPLVLNGTMQACAGDKLYHQARYNWPYYTVTDEMAFKDTAADQKRRKIYLRRAERFLPIAADSPMRDFERDQINRMITDLEAAGSRVYLMYLPSLGETSISQADLDAIGRAFPDRPFLHPFALFETEIGEDLAKSFADTHHTTPYGALLYSRYFADEIVRLVP